MPADSFDDLFSPPAPESTPAPAPTAHESSTPAPAGTPPAATAGDEFEIPGVGRVSREEAIRGYLRQQDYTRSKMALSNTQRDQARLQQQNAAMEAALTNLQAFLKDRTKLSEHLKQLGGGGPEPDADALLTTSEAQALLRRQLGESEVGFQRRLQEMEQRITTAGYRQQYEGLINAKLGEIGGRHPELRAVPGMELLLREAVKSRQPQTIEDALTLYDQAADFYMDRLKGFTKQALVQPGNPVLHGIEPPNTAAPGTPGTPPEFSGVRDPNLRAQVERDIAAMFR